MSWHMLNTSDISVSPDSADYSFEVSSTAEPSQTSDFSQHVWAKIGVLPASQHLLLVSMMQKMGAELN